MQQRALRTLKIQHGLRTAIEDGSLQLHFQPKHDGMTGAIVGAEALARWCHMELGPVPPMEFITVAERSGQIARLGEWVIRETCRQLVEWRDRARVIHVVQTLLRRAYFETSHVNSRLRETLDSAGRARRELLEHVVPTLM